MWGRALSPVRRGEAPRHAESTHYSYEDEDQSAAWHASDNSRGARAGKSPRPQLVPTTPSRTSPNSSPAAARNLLSRKHAVEEPTGKRGFRPGQKVRHPKYGEGTVYQREGEGEEAKITVQFPRFGLKKLVEKYAQLERA